MSYSISMDLCHDYDEMVRTWLQKQGIDAESTGFDLWYEFFNLQKKSVRAQKRKVHYSKEFTCPKDMEKGLNLLIRKFENGEDVSLHLSKDAGTPEKFDELLYDWGIYHFHLGEEVDDKTGRIVRTGPLLFARIDNENVYCINVYSHGRSVQQPWSKQTMLKIIHDNWPETIKRYKLPDGVELYPETIPLPSDEQYATLRKEGISVFIFVDKGVAYFSPGGGYMATGHSFEIILYCQRIHNTLKRYELYVEERITSLVEQIEKTTKKKAGDKLHFKLIEIQGAFYVAEMKNRVALLKVTL